MFCDEGSRERTYLLAWIIPIATILPIRSSIPRPIRIVPSPLNLAKPRQIRDRRGPRGAVPARGDGGDEVGEGEEGYGD